METREETKDQTSTVNEEEKQQNQNEDQQTNPRSPLNNSHEEEVISFSLHPMSQFILRFEKYEVNIT